MKRGRERGMIKSMKAVLECRNIHMKVLEAGLLFQKSYSLLPLLSRLH